MAKVLFICAGGVGRSQIARGFYNHYTESEDAYSAGTNSQTPIEFAKGLPEELCQLMLEEGIDIRHQRVKTIDEKAVENTERILSCVEKNSVRIFCLNQAK